MHPKREGTILLCGGTRQTGKSWSLNQVCDRLEQENRFDVIKIELEDLKIQKNIQKVLKFIGHTILKALGKMFLI